MLEWHGYCKYDAEWKMGPTSLSCFTLYFHCNMFEVRNGYIVHKELCFVPNTVTSTCNPSPKGDRDDMIVNSSPSWATL